MLERENSFEGRQVPDNIREGVKMNSCLVVVYSPAEVSASERAQLENFKPTGSELDLVDSLSLPLVPPSDLTDVYLLSGGVQFL